jgi:hypothetical protein
MEMTDGQILIFILLFIVGITGGYIVRSLWTTRLNQTYEVKWRHFIHVVDAGNGYNVSTTQGIILGVFTQTEPDLSYTYTGSMMAKDRVYIWAMAQALKEINDE